jgi:predicted acylesterase/phospholipase RssA
MASLWKASSALMRSPGKTAGCGLHGTRISRDEDGVTENATEPTPFRVLASDGGGAKGFYTLGALKEIEALVGRRLCEKFGLIYGTSPAPSSPRSWGSGSR